MHDDTNVVVPTTEGEAPVVVTEETSEVAEAVAEVAQEETPAVEPEVIA